MKPYRGPPMTLGSAAAAHVRFMVWCKACGYRAEPDPAEQARRYGARDVSARLARPQCGSRDVDIVVTDPLAPDG